MAFILQNTSQSHLDLILYCIVYECVYLVLVHLNQIHSFHCTRLYLHPVNMCICMTYCNVQNHIISIVKMKDNSGCRHEGTTRMQFERNLKCKWSIIMIIVNLFFLNIFKKCVSHIFLFVNGINLPHTLPFNCNASFTRTFNSIWIAFTNFSYLIRIDSN